MKSKLGCTNAFSITRSNFSAGLGYILSDIPKCVSTEGTRAQPRLRPNDDEISTTISAGDLVSFALDQSEAAD